MKYLRNFLAYIRTNIFFLSDIVLIFLSVFSLTINNEENVFDVVRIFITSNFGVCESVQVPLYLKQTVKVIDEIAGHIAGLYSTGQI